MLPPLCRRSACNLVVEVYCQMFRQEKAPVLELQFIGLSDARIGSASCVMADQAMGVHLKCLQVVAETLRDCRRNFHLQMMEFMSNKAVYMAQKPIEDLRQALLRDSGDTLYPAIFCYLNFCYPMQCSSLALDL